MFSFLSRRLGTAPSSSSSGTADITSIPHSPPSPAPVPPPSKSPSPQEIITDPKPLYALIASVPPQTLHAYTLAHLIPPTQPLSPLSFPHITLPSDPPSPTTLTTLTNFFSTLAPPPRLHCVRCHKPYFEVENTDRSCLVPHDDESAEVERVGVNGRGKGIGTEYETLWGCCGKNVEGDGDMGPPDGWCYEGKHTTDVKRARFRADSTLYDDKLTSCEDLRCHEPPTSSPPRSTREGANKRRRTLMEEGDGEDAQSVEGSTVSGGSSNKMSLDETTAPPKPKRAHHSKSVSVSSKPDKQKKNEASEMMDVDSTNESITQSQPQIPATPKSPPRSRKPRKSAGGSITPGPKLKTNIKSPLVSSFGPPSPPAEDNTQSHAEEEKATLPLPRPVVEIRTEEDGSPLLKDVQTNAADLRRKSSKTTLDEQVDKDKPRAKTRARRNTVVEASKPTVDSPSVKPKSSAPSIKPKSSSGALKSKSSVASLRSTRNVVKPPSTTSSMSSHQKPQSKAGGGRKRGKVLGEVVSTSVDGEEHV